MRLIDEKGEQLGIMATEKALALAAERGLDLAEVAPNVNPPACKILDYGKYQYHQKKVETKHKKMQKKGGIKGVRLGFKTGNHDIDIKINQAKKFIEDGNTVKVALIFKGREVIYKALALEKMQRVEEALKEVAQVDEHPKLQGNTLIMILTPHK